jgi:hypothetical protein
MHRELPHSLGNEHSPSVMTLERQAQTKTLVLPYYHIKDYADNQQRDEWCPLGTNGLTDSSGTRTS